MNNRENYGEMSDLEEPQTRTLYIPELRRPKIGMAIYIARDARHMGVFRSFCHSSRSFILRALSTP